MALKSRDCHKSQFKTLDPWFELELSLKHNILLKNLLYLFVIFFYSDFEAIFRQKEVNREMQKQRLREELENYQSLLHMP